MPIEEAVDKAVQYAISNNYLDGFFKKHREGIMLSCLTEFNEEVFRKGIHEEGFAEGREAAIITSIQILREVNISKETVLQQIMEKYELTKEETEKVVNSHWE